MTELSTAQINLDRTRVLSPVNGYVTNLLLREGDYTTRGTRNVSVLDSDSFWVVGYFEETKLPSIHLGDKAAVALMAYRDPVYGHVESLARGINTPNNDRARWGWRPSAPCSPGSAWRSVSPSASTSTQCPRRYSSRPA